VETSSVCASHCPVRIMRVGILIPADKTYYSCVVVKRIGICETDTALIILVVTKELCYSLSWRDYY